MHFRAHWQWQAHFCSSLKPSSGSFTHSGSFCWRPHDADHSANLSPTSGCWIFGPWSHAWLGSRLWPALFALGFWGTPCSICTHCRGSISSSKLVRNSWLRLFVFKRSRQVGLNLIVLLILLIALILCNETSSSPPTLLHYVLLSSFALACGLGGALLGSCGHPSLTTKPTTKLLFHHSQPCGDSGGMILNPSLPFHPCLAFHPLPVCT